MFNHAVYFWLKPDLTPEQVAAFEGGLASLGAVKSVKALHVGRPAATDRPVIERSYSYALVETFADQAGHDDYQEHPVHQAFVEQFKELWTRVLIFDSEDVG
jgi:hypothetical protein